jgi:5-methylcytosine-specific restriction endonuclease McrA
MANAPIARIRTCQQCGSSPITGYKFCSPACRRVSVGWTPEPRVKQERQVKVSRPRPSAPIRTCVVCKVEFKRPNRAKRDAGLCCSRECGFELIRQRGEASRKLYVEIGVYRRWARRNVARDRAERVRLSYEHTAQARYEAAKVQRHAAFANIACAVCGGAVGYSGTGMPRTYCSVGCQDAGEPSLRSRRVAMLKRRPKIYGVAIEAVDPLVVLNRDGWRCHICGGDAPKEARGTMRWDAPEVDHIIPLARGGSHTYANVACAHRRCNIVKGDGAINGQAGADPERRWVHR